MFKLIDEFLGKIILGIIGFIKFVFWVVVAIILYFVCTSLGVL